MRRPSGKRVRLHHCRPGFAPSVQLSTRIRQKNGHRLSLPRFNIVSLAFAFHLSVPVFLSCTFPCCPSLARRPSVPTCPASCAPKIVEGSLCQCPLWHVRAQGSARRTNCQGSHFQKFTQSCWRVFHQRCYLDRLLEVCTCGDSALCNLFFPGSERVTKVTSLVIHLFSHLARGLRMPLKRAAIRCPPLPSYTSLSARHASRPCRRGMSETRDRAWPSHFFTSKERIVWPINRLLSSKPSCLMSDDCSAATSRCVPIFRQVRIRLKLHSPSFPVCVCTVHIRNSNGVSRVTCFSCHDARTRGQILSNHWIKDAGSSKRATEEDDSSCLFSNSATNNISTQRCRVNSAPSRLRHRV